MESGKGVKEKTRVVGKIAGPSESIPVRSAGYPRHTVKAKEVNQQRKRRGRGHLSEAAVFWRLDGETPGLAAAAPRRAAVPLEGRLRACPPLSLPLLHRHRTPLILLLPNRPRGCSREPRHPRPLPSPPQKCRSRGCRRLLVALRLQTKAAPSAKAEDDGRHEMRIEEGVADPLVGIVVGSRGYGHGRPKKRQRIVEEERKSRVSVGWGWEAPTRERGGGERTASAVR